MYLRRINRHKDGKDHYYWALLESYRTDKGVRQRVIGYIGDVSKKKARQASPSFETVSSYQTDFFTEEELPETLSIDPRKTRSERSRSFGGVWLGHLLFEKLGLGDFFREHDAARHILFKILLIGRFYHPSSELHLSEHVYSHSAMEDLFGIPCKKLYVQKLYRALDKLLPYKDRLEQHLTERLGTLFNLTYDLFLYDVTSTYVEGDHAGSTLCKRGYSRDSRPDCKQVCIALVVTREGIPLGYEVFSGNTHDSTTVEDIVTGMEKKYGSADRIWVMDRGMVSEKNLTFLRTSGRRYIIGAPKSSLKHVEQSLLKQDWHTVHEGVEVKQITSPQYDQEVFIICKSKDRALKEKAIHDRFIKRIDDGIKKLHAYCKKTKGKQTLQIIERRIGRLLQQNSRGAVFYDIEAEYDHEQQKTLLHVTKNDDDAHWARMTEGHYLMRSNITDWKPEELWRAYIHLTDAESAFKIQKHDLGLRPLWHQKDERIKAHIFVCFVAFVLWKTFALMCKNAGLGDEPRQVFEEIKTLNMVDVVLTTTQGKEIKIRTIPRPDKPLQILLHLLGIQLPERLTRRAL